MTDDIFLATFHFEDPSGASQTGCYFQQTADNAATILDTDELGKALEAQVGPSIINAIADTFWFTGVRVRKVYDSPCPQYLSTATPQAGLASGPGLPSNCCAQLTLTQTQFSLKSNGKMFWPGVGEPGTVAGNMTALYQVAWQAVGTALVTPINSIADTGVYELGIISQKVLNLAPPLKDWPGAFAFSNAVSASPRIAIQRRRTTKVIGAAI